MKKFKILIIIFFYGSISFGQSEPRLGEQVTIGVSWTYKNGTNNFTNIKYHEWSSSSNLAINLNSNLNLGFNILGISKRKKDENGKQQKTRYDFYSVFIQYDFLPKKQDRLFLETSYGFSDYCTCGEYEPRFRKNTSYLGVGAGYSLPFWSKNNVTTLLDLSVISYNVLNKVDNKKPFFQYIIGLDIMLNRKRKEKK